MGEGESHTAGGPTKASEVCRASMPPLREAIQPYVVESTPAILSVGLRCRKYGYAFHWFAYSHPFIVTPDNMMVQMHTIEDLPILKLGEVPKEPPFRKKYPGWCHPTSKWEHGTYRAKVGNKNAFKAVPR